MDKYFLCLANSYKYGNRCLAGVEVRQTSSGFEVVMDYWKHPIWFRPVKRLSNKGSVPNMEAENILLFDVILATNVEKCTDDAAIENYYYDKLEIVGALPMSNELCNAMSHSNRRVIFGNTYASLTQEQFSRVDYSLLFVKAENVNCYLKDRKDKQPQPRIKFTYNNLGYDLPVTDPNFRHLMERNLEAANSFSNYYLTLSLGIAFEDDRHYKLIAAVIHD